MLANLPNIESIHVEGNQLTFDGMEAIKAKNNIAFTYIQVPTNVLRARAREMGMRTLREDGIRKVLAGLTTPDEVIRATVGDDT